ncbi:MAG: hypothetical protein ABJL67_13210, partial [Sulfitobacter sp.]
AGDLAGHVLLTRTHKTAPPVLPALAPSSQNPPTNKGIESANGHPIKKEFFNKIRPFFGKTTCCEFR